MDYICIYITKNYSALAPKKILRFFSDFHHDLKVMVLIYIGGGKLNRGGENHIISMDP